ILLWSICATSLEQDSILLVELLQCLRLKFKPIVCTDTSNAFVELRLDHPTKHEGVPEPRVPKFRLIYVAAVYCQSLMFCDKEV
ncbi:unnamed protein product, partial [Linum tenue]